MFPTTGRTATTFAPNDFVTRGQTAAFVYRSNNAVKQESQEVSAVVSNITTQH